MIPVEAAEKQTSQWANDPAPATRETNQRGVQRSLPSTARKAFRESENIIPQHGFLAVQGGIAGEPECIGVFAASDGAVKHQPAMGLIKTNSPRFWLVGGKRPDKHDIARSYDGVHARTLGLKVDRDVLTEQSRHDLPGIRRMTGYGHQFFRHGKR